MPSNASADPGWSAPPESGPHTADRWSNPSERWSRPPWGERGRPPGTRWFAPIVAALVQIPGLFIAGRDAANDPVALGFALLAFAASFLLLGARRYPGPTVVAIAVLCGPAIAVTTGPPLLRRRQRGRARRPGLGVVDARRLRDRRSRGRLPVARPARRHAAPADHRA